ncbi:MAG: hypothetical protein JWO58_2304 [Chitinophagaceae bacterium]|nr:hypothetical protein [Chitinophagaceae bacterium]
MKMCNSITVSFILLFLQLQPTCAQKLILQNLTELPSTESCYTFELGDSMTISICKLDATTQLTASDPNNFWIGQNASGVKHSDIAIIFSKPITSLNFIMSHFNFDNNGGEFLNGFNIYDETGKEIKSSVVDWETGSSVNNTSSSFSTVFNKKKRTIRANSGGWGPETGGRLYVSSSTPFTRFTMHQEVVYGYPNGIIISNEINFTTPLPVVEAIIKKDSVEKEFIPPIIADTKTDSIVWVKEVTPVAKTDSIKKEPVKSTVKKQPVKTTPKPIKKTEPKKAVKVEKEKPAPKKQVVAKIPASKTEIKKAPVKTTTTPAVAKKEIKKEAPVEKTHDLSQARLLTIGEKIKLEKVFFKQSLAELLPDSYPQLDTLVDILNEQKKLEIEIQGHTDNQGVPSLNMELSEKRVEAVKAYLVSQGITPERLTGKGFGDSQPCIDNETEEHRKQNRRVEFMITKK